MINEVKHYAFPYQTDGELVLKCPQGTGVIPLHEHIEGRLPRGFLPVNFDFAIGDALETEFVLSCDTNALNDTDRLKVILGETEINQTLQGCIRGKMLFYFTFQTY